MAILADFISIQVKAGRRSKYVNEGTGGTGGVREDAVMLCGGRVKAVMYSGVRLYTNQGHVYGFSGCGTA